MRRVRASSGSPRNLPLAVYDQGDTLGDTLLNVCASRAAMPMARQTRRHEVNTLQLYD